MIQRSKQDALPVGGSFLLRESSPERTFTPEDLTEENQAIAQTTEEFFRSHLSEDRDADPADVLRHSADLGLTAVLIPEDLGGMDLDLISAGVVADRLAGDAGYALCHCYHSGAATLPILWYGSEQQRERYLPKIAVGEMVAAHCYPSDQAPGAIAVPGPDSASFTLSAKGLRGRNALLGDLLTVVAYEDAERQTAFLIERATDGVSVADDGSVSLERVSVDASGVLGERGSGDEVTAPARGLERLLLAHAASGAARTIAFELMDFVPAPEVGDLARQHLADAVAGAFAADASACRLSGLVWAMAGTGGPLPDAIQEYAVECSLSWAAARQQLRRVIQSASQLRAVLGGLPAAHTERSWREFGSRQPSSMDLEYVGAATTLIERAREGRLPLPAAVKALSKELLTGLSDRPTPDPLTWAAAGAARAKKATLLALGSAFSRFGPEIDGHPAVLSAIGELATLSWSIESAFLRASKLNSAGVSGPWVDVAAVFAQQALGRAELVARSLLAYSISGDELRNHLVFLRRLTRPEPIDEFSARGRIASYLLETSKAAE